MRILVIDDHPLVHDALGTVLGGVAPELEVAGASALEEGLALAAREPRPELALLDLNLPGYSGLAALERWRQELPDVPVVVLSADAARERVMAAIDLGAMGFIPKTAKMGAMRDALQRVLSGHIFVPAEVLRQADTEAAAGVVPAAPASAAELGLTGRQLDVLALVLRGLPNKLICRELGLAEGTVKIHVSAVLRKLGAANRTQAVLAANRLGLRLESRAPRRG